MHIIYPNCPALSNLVAGTFSSSNPRLSAEVPDQARTLDYLLYSLLNVIPNSLPICICPCPVVKKSGLQITKNVLLGHHHSVDLLLGSGFDSLTVVLTFCFLVVGRPPGASFLPVHELEHISRRYPDKLSPSHHASDVCLDCVLKRLHEDRKYVGEPVGCFRILGKMIACQ